MTFNPEQLYVKRALQIQVEDGASASVSSAQSGSSSDTASTDADAANAGSSSASASSETGAADGSSASSVSSESSSSSSADTTRQTSADGTTSSQQSSQSASSDVNGASDAYASTDGQDQQTCPILKLPGLLHLEAKSSSWFRRSGSMDNPNKVSMASWTQNLVAQKWKTLYLRDVDGKLALKAVPMDKDVLSRNYDWAPKNSSGDVELFNSYATDLRQQAGWVAESDTSKTWVALMDCTGALLFVFCLQAGEPGHTDIFDRFGYLLAHSLNDASIARMQFVDINGHLLATAESPGLWQNIPRSDLPKDDAYGGILFYELGYEAGGYVNASRLMDVDYRWVIASAMQVNAIYEAEDGWTPNAQLVVAVATSCCAALGAVILFCGCYFIYRIVFPSPDVTYMTSTGGGPHWAKTVNPFLWVPDGRISRKALISSRGF